MNGYMKHWFRNLLTPPVFEDEQKNHQAYLLHYILLGLIAIPIPNFLRAHCITRERKQGVDPSHCRGKHEFRTFLLFAAWVCKRGGVFAGNCVLVVFHCLSSDRSGGARRVLSLGVSDRYHDRGAFN